MNVSVKEENGFILNSTFACGSENSLLDFREYAVILAYLAKTLELLKECFAPQDTVTIYTVVLIYFIQGFTYLFDIKTYYDMSILSLKYPTLKFSYDSLSKLYDILRRGQANVLKFEEKLVAECLRQIAIDGHVFGCESADNELVEKEYKFKN